MSNDADLVYRLNSQDQITFINEAWVNFAVANDAPRLIPERVLGRSLWEFISDETTTTLYKEILDQVHAGQQMTFNFRCDSPANRRLMEMTISKLPSGEVQFETRTISEEVRTPKELLDRYAPRIGEVLHICGWCKRVDVGAGIWAEIEDAIEAFSLFERGALPRLTHGMCKECFETISSEIAMQEGVGRLPA